MDPVEVFEVRVLPAGIRVGSYFARDRESWTAVHVHQADDLIAEPRGLLLHELIHRRLGAMARHENEKLVVRLSARVEPGIVIVESLVDRGIRCLGRNAVRQDSERSENIPGPRSERGRMARPESPQPVSVVSATTTANVEWERQRMVSPLGRNALAALQPGGAAMRGVGGGIPRTREEAKEPLAGVALRPWQTRSQGRPGGAGASRPVPRAAHRSPISEWRTEDGLTRSNRSNPATPSGGKNHAASGS